MQILPAICIASCAISRAARSVYLREHVRRRERMRHRNRLPTIPSSGSIKSPVPEMRNVFLSIRTTIIASRWRISCLSANLWRAPTAARLSLSVILLQLRFESGKARMNLPMTRQIRPEFFRCTAGESSVRRLDDGIAERHLTSLATTTLSSRRTARIVVLRTLPDRDRPREAGFKGNGMLGL